MGTFGQLAFGLAFGIDNIRSSRAILSMHSESIKEFGIKFIDLKSLVYYLGTKNPDPFML